jgi:uncharacterized protein
MSNRWKREYICGFLEKDIAHRGFDIPVARLGTLWRMLAHLHGQMLNLSDLAVA